MANPTVVAGSPAASGSGAAISVNWSARGAAAGDILLWFVNTANETIGANPPTGFTEIGASTGIGTAGTAGALKAYAFAKLYDGTEGSVSIGDSGDYQEQTVLVVRGARLSELYHKISVVEEPSATTSVSLPSVTTETNECLIIGYVASDEDTASARYSGWANSNLTSITEEIDHATTAGTGGGSAIVSGAQATAGAVGATTATRDAASVMTYITVAFRPPAAGTADMVADIAATGALAGTSKTYGAAASALAATATLAGTLTAGSSDMTAALTATGTLAGGVWTLPTVSRPAGGGDGDVAATVITGGATATPTINLFGDPETNANAGTAWQQTNLVIDLKEAGKSPFITLDFSTWRNGTVPPINRLYWSAPEDSDSCAAFDNRSVAGTVMTVWNDTPLPQQIEVSFTPPWRDPEIKAWLVANDANARMHRPAAATTLNVSSIAPNKYAYFDFPAATSPDGIDVDPYYAYTWLVTDDSLQPANGAPKIGIICPWVHAGEINGLRKLKQFADRLLTQSDTLTQYLLRHYEFLFLLPGIGGMAGGMARGACEPTDVGDDPNRVWWLNALSNSGISDPIGSIDATIAAIVSEFGLTADDKIDCGGEVSFHGQRADETNLFCYYSTDLTGLAAQFHTRLAANYAGTIGNLGSALSSNTSSRFAYDSTRYGLCCTAEWGYWSTDFLGETASVDAIAQSLEDVHEAGYFGSYMAAALTASAALAGTAVGTAPLAADLTATAALAGMVTTRAEMAGSLSATGTLAGTLSAGGNDMTASLSASAVLAGVGGAYANAGSGITAIATLAGAATTRAEMLAGVSASAVLAGAMAGNADDMAAELLAVAALTGAMSCYAMVSSGVSAIGTLSGNLGTDQPGGNRPPPRRRMNAGTWDRRMAA